MSAKISMSFLLLSSAAALLVACGEDKPAETGGAGGVQCPPGQYYDGRFCQTQGAQPAPAATAAPTDTGTAAPAPAASVPVHTTAAGPTATPLDPTAAQAATQLIAPLGTQHAPAGAKPVGAAIAGNFQQGQSLETQIQMNPGKCYTVVGVALPPAAELDIALVPVLPIPGLPSPTLAADVNSKGTTSVVGAKPDCVKWAWPMSGMVKVVMTVSQGSGVAAAQVFEK